MILNGYDRGFIYGAVLVLSEFDEASIVIHGPMGCYSQFFEASMASQKFIYFTSSVMSNKDIIFGGENSLKNELKAMKLSEACKVRFVITANAANIIGEDIDAIVSQIIRDDPAQSLIAIRGKLGADHYQGINQALLTLSKNFTKPSEKRKKVINLIGNIGGSIRWKEDLYVLKRLLNKIGIKANLIAVDLVRDDIERWSSAVLTIKIIPEIGKEVAEYLNQMYDIPWLDIESPIGIHGTSRWLQLIAERLGVNALPALEELDEINNQIKIVAKSLLWDQRINAIQNLRFGVVCEAGTAVPFVRFLIEEMGIKPIFVGLKNHAVFDLEWLENTGVKVLNNIDRDIVEAQFRESDIECLIGSSYELDIAKSRGKRWVHICNPNYHIINLKSKPYFGFEGVVNLIEDIMNVLV